MVISSVRPPLIAIVSAGHVDVVFLVVDDPGVLLNLIARLTTPKRVVKGRILRFEGLPLPRLTV